MILVYVYTRHAIEKMGGLGAEKEDVERTIVQGMKWKEEHSEKWHAQMAGIEVVFARESENIVIIIVYREGRAP